MWSRCSKETAFAHERKIPKQSINNRKSFFFFFSYVLVIDVRCKVPHFKSIETHVLFNFVVWHMKGTRDGKYDVRTHTHNAENLKPTIAKITKWIIFASENVKYIRKMSISHGQVAKTRGMLISWKLISKEAFPSLAFSFLFDCLFKWHTLIVEIQMRIQLHSRINDDS